MNGRVSKGSVAETETRGAQARTAIWHWFIDEQIGRGAAAVLLLLLSTTSLLLLLNLPVLGAILLLRIVLLGLPSLLTLLAFFLLAAIVWGRSRVAVASGSLAYLAMGLVLALIPVGYLESVWRGGFSSLGIFIWPTVILRFLGDMMGWWPGPE